MLAPHALVLVVVPAPCPCDSQPPLWPLRVTSCPSVLRCIVALRAFLLWGVTEAPVGALRLRAHAMPPCIDCLSNPDSSRPLRSSACPSPQLSALTATSRRMFHAPLRHCHVTSLHAAVRQRRGPNPSPRCFTPPPSRVAIPDRSGHYGAMQPEPKAVASPFACSASRAGAVSSASEARHKVDSRHLDGFLPFAQIAPQLLLESFAQFLARDCSWVSRTAQLRAHGLRNVLLVKCDRGLALAAASLGLARRLRRHAVRSAHLLDRRVRRALRARRWYATAAATATHRVRRAGG